METKLYVVVPCYNEEAVLPISMGVLIDKVKELINSGLISAESKIVFADDGSSDDTWRIISEASKEHGEIIGLKLSIVKDIKMHFLQG